MIIDRKPVDHGVPTLGHVRAAMQITAHRKMLVARREEKLHTLWLIGGVAVAGLLFLAHSCQHAGRVFTWGIYVPLILIPPYVMGSLWLLAIYGRRYGTQLLHPLPQIPHRHLKVLADQRFPFWRATIQLENERRALLECFAGYSPPRRATSSVLLEVTNTHLRIAHELTDELRKLEIRGGLNSADSVHLSDNIKEMVEEMTATLEADVRMLHAFRIAPVE